MIAHDLIGLNYEYKFWFINEVYYEKIFRHTNNILFIITFVLALSNFIYASPAINDISEEDAIRLATLYYAMNTQEEQICFDHYAVTFLYDENSDITYYAVDFFEKEESKGYVIIGKNLKHIQCAEISLEGEPISVNMYTFCPYQI